MPSILKTFRKGKGEHMIGSDRYIDLGDIEFEDMGPENLTFVKVAEIYRYEDISNLANLVYNGNILILDYNSMANDQLALKRIINELKSVVKDINGDVAGIGKNLIMVTPSGVKVDRNKLRGPY